MGRVRRRVLAGGCVAAAVGTLCVLGHAQVVVPSPPSPGARLAWDHAGGNVRWFEVRVDGSVGARLEVGEGQPHPPFEAPVPLMVPGLRTIEVAACNEYGCAASEPLEVLVVAGPIRWWAPKSGK